MSVSTRPIESARQRIVVAFGTRPEAIKLFPVIEELKHSRAADVKVIVTAQHRGMLDQVLSMAGIIPDIDLDLMQQGQSLDGLAARIIERFGEALDMLKPDRVIVHGDTLTTMVVSLACYFRKIPVGHVEAGLRSGNIYSPWPEEANRKITAVVADMHFAPTLRAAQALQKEGIDATRVHITGNTGIDALLRTRERISRHGLQCKELDEVGARFAGKRIIAVTAHRRENFGRGMQQIALALRQLAGRDDAAILFPLHPNPQVAPVMRAALSDLPNVALLGPQDYPAFVRIMEMSDVILTDSGGIQEEAPSLGKPVLVMRDETERPEAVEAGTARLVGTDSARIVAEAARMLDDPITRAAMTRPQNPFGDGQAARRIAELLTSGHQEGNRHEAEA